MQFPRKIAMRHQMAPLPHRCFRGRSIIISGIGWGAGLLLSACGPSGSGGAGGTVNPPNVAATIPNGSPEYQALVKEACEIINGSRCTIELNTAARMKGPNDNLVIHTVSVIEGRNARITAPWILASELHTKNAIKNKLNPASYDVDHSVFSQIDLRSITRAKVIDPSSSNAVQTHENSSTTVAVVKTPYWAVVTEGPGFSGTFVAGNFQSPALESNVAAFNNKAKANRLASILNKLASLAKAS